MSIFIPVLSNFHTTSLWNKTRELAMEIISLTFHPLQEVAILQGINISQIVTPSVNSHLYLCYN